jgi:hypothetical protein
MEHSTRSLSDLRRHLQMNNSVGGVPLAHKTIPLEAARNRLALIWFPVSALFMLLLIAQSILGAYGDEVQRVWGWALPNFLPTVALMVSVFASEALLPSSDRAPSVRRNFFRLSFALSVFYLLVLLIPVLLQPFVAASDPDLVDKRIQLLETSNIWLGPLQGIVVTALGVLFFLKDEGTGPATTGAKP